MRKLGMMATGAALAALAACGGGTKAGNNVATTVTNDVYVGDDLGNGLLGNDVVLNDSGLNASSGNGSAGGDASSNATANASGNRL